MIRIEIMRRLDCKQGRRRNRIDPRLIIHEENEAAAIAEIKALRIAGEEIAPGYMPMLEARLFDRDAFQAWVKSGDSKTPPKPFRTLSAAEIEAL
jgi:hypothetical protein